MSFAVLLCIVFFILFFCKRIHKTKESRKDEQNIDGIVDNSKGAPFEETKENEYDYINENLVLRTSTFRQRPSNEYLDNTRSSARSEAQKLQTSRNQTSMEFSIQRSSHDVEPDNILNLTNHNHYTSLIDDGGYLNPYATITNDGT